MERTVSQRGQARPTPEYGSRRYRVAGNGPDSDRAPESGVAGWIALRRAHEGGVANVAGQWLDSGRRVPGYVADAWTGSPALGCFGNPPNSGRPPVEQFPPPIPAPGGRPDTTTPVGSAANADQVVINPCVQLPTTSVDPVSGPGLDLVASLVLQRVHGGG